MRPTTPAGPWGGRGGKLMAVSLAVGVFSGLSLLLFIIFLIVAVAANELDDDGLLVIGTAAGFCWAVR